MNSPGWKKSLSKLFTSPLARSGAGRRSAPRASAKRSQPMSQLVIETLESRDVPAIINMTVAPISPTEGVALGSPAAPLPVATFQVDNYLGFDQSIQFSAAIGWGDGTASSGLGSTTIQFLSNDGAGRASYQVFGYHTYRHASNPLTPLNLDVVVFDNTGPGTTQAASTPITVIDQPLTAAGVQPVVAATAGAPLVYVDVATFTDANPLALAGDYTATITWGNPTQTTSGTVVQDTNGVFHVLGSHTFDGAAPASSAYTVTILDVTASVTINNTATVARAAILVGALPVAGTVNIPTAAGVIATFTDTGGADPLASYTATIDWGDGTPTSVGTVAALGGNQFSVSAPAHTYPQPGVFATRVTVANALDGTSGVGGSTAVIANSILTATPAAGITAVEGTTLTALVATFTDTDPTRPTSAYTATITWGDGTTSAGVITQPGGAGTAFQVSGSHIYQVDGPYPITVLIQNDNGSRTTTTTTATVTEAGIATNPAPLVIRGQQNVALVGVDVATFTSGNPFETAANFAASIAWGDGTTSAGVIVVDAFGTFHVQGIHTYTSTGTFTPLVTVSEVGGGGVLGQVQATVTIVATPLLVTATPVQATEGVALPNAQNTTNGTVVATFVDLFGADPLASYSASIDWGNGLTTPGTIVAGVGPNFVVVAPAAPPVVYANAGMYTVKVTVMNVDLSQTSGFFQAVGVTTATVADAPLAADPTQPVVTAFQGTPLAGVPVGRFTDGNPAGSVTDFTATIDWGDGTPQSAGQVVQPGGVGTPFVVLGNHTYANPTTPPAAPYAVTVTVVDVGGSRVTTRTTANVTASVITGTPTVLTGVEGQPIGNGVVAYFTDSGIAGPVSSYSASINWGTGLPGSVTFGQIVPLGGNSFQVLGTYTYPRENVAPNMPYSVTVSISHNGLAATTVVSQANIADAPISGVAVPVFATEGVAFTGTVAIFTDANPNGTAADFTATISWGDGSTSTGRVVRSGASYLVGGADPVSGLGHVYTREGTFAFSVTVRDGAPGGAEFTAFQTATVFDAPLTATGINTTIVEGPLPAVPLPGVVAPTFNVATFTDAGNVPPAAPNPPSEYTATINWGDGAVTTGVIGNPTLLLGTLVYPVTGQHLYADVGSYFVTVTVRTSGTSSTSTTAVITVTDAVLTAGPATALTAVEGSGFTSQVATFSDADLLGRISDYSATIAWGDGTTSAGVIGQISTPLGTPPQFTVVGTHTYADPSAAGAPYPVTVTVRGVTGGNSTTATATVAVGSAPLSSEGGTVHGVEGNSTGSVLIGTFTDADPQSALAEFTTGGGSITIDWGNGGGPVPLPPSAVTAVGSPSGVTYRINAAFTYPRPGTYPITVVVTDRFGASTVIQSVALIAAAPLVAAPAGTQPAIGTTEGGTYTGPVFRFTDGNPLSVPSEFAATINWGDGTTDTGVVTQPGGPGTTYVVSGSHRYLDNGNYTVGVFVQKTGGGSTVNYTTTAVVTGVVPTAVISNAGPVGEGSPVTVSLSDPQDPSPTDTAAGFRYSFATSAAGLAGSYAGAQPGSSAQFTFPDGPSTQTVFGRIFDKDGLFSDYQTVVTVTNVNPTATLSVSGPFIPKKPFTVTFTNQADPSPTDTAAGFRYQFDFGDGNGFGAPTTSPTATFTPPRPGTYVVRGRIIDKDGGVTEYTANPQGNVVIPNVDVFAVGNGIGAGPIVKVYSSLDNSLVASFTAYEPTFRGGVLVATGDVTGDGIPDIITGTGVGGGPVVKVFDGVTFFEIASLMAYEASFRGGVFVAAGDTDGDGRAEIITGTGIGGGPVVKVFDGRTNALRSSFAAYDISARGGVFVAAGDTTGDGKAEVITGAGQGGGPHVKVFDQFGNTIRSFFAYDSSFPGGVTVSAGDLYGLGYADIVTGTGVGGGPEVRVLDSQNGRLKDNFAAFGPDRSTGQPLRNGFSVSASHVIGPTGKAAIIAAAGPDYGPTVRLFDAVTHASLGEILPYEETFTGGAYVG
ncbi:beta strand repeat-containing protein [Urbifossiella limnaea]|uniref:PKD domain protein n=1 Tax=Urbifossiella limnaea TaxID=2528023 RepID=A0A517Y3C5_9BACT|nr:PKD domain-containing protein [Urbifossiella limnaea]QDU24237.1 PKD domain protein [Urbifossiella limnaea]